MSNYIPRAGTSRASLFGMAMPTEDSLATWWAFRRRCCGVSSSSGTVDGERHWTLHPSPRIDPAGSSSKLGGFSLHSHATPVSLTDIQVALLSARLSPAAIAHLAERVKFKRIIITSHTSRAAKAAVEIPSSTSDTSIECFQAASIETLLSVKATLCEEAPPAFNVINELDRNTIILHSSGSTGLPKPIHQTHKYILNYAACHRFSPDEDVSGLCTSTLPLFHVRTLS